MGNSEVGHNALGCGQIYSQGAKLVNESIESGDFFKTEKWEHTVGAAAKAGKAVHFFGLLSDGNVHSHINQLFKMIQGAVNSGAKKVYVHPLLDGRDVAPDSGLKYVGMLEDELAKHRANGVDARIASGGGRMEVTMDRYESDWNIVRRGWEAMVHGNIVKEITPDIGDAYPGYFKSATEAITLARKLFPKKLDQYNPVFVIVGEDGKPIAPMQDGDAVINFNFRGDRAIQISKAFTMDDAKFTYFPRGARPSVHYAGLLEYDAEVHVPPVYLVPPPKITNISAEYTCAQEISSFAIAETHKFGHMTFFWNGNRSGYINEKYEKFVQVTSLPNEMTESHPEMKAAEVTDKLIEALESGKYKYLRVNYANPDMVGHTGNIDSVVKAITCINEQLKRLVPVIERLGGIAMITADHGNAEQMYDKAGVLMTSHTTNPVNFFIVDPQNNGEYVVDTTGIATPGLTNLTASLINLLGYEAPSMYDKSLIKFTAKN